MIKLHQLPLYAKILIGMLSGILLGFVAIRFGFSHGITEWVKPFGDIFMRVLKMIAIPLVMVSLIKGVGNLSNLSSLSRIGIRTFLLYICTTVIAITVGLVLAEVIAPGKMVSSESAASLQASYHTSVAERSQQAEAMSDTPPLQFLVDIFPDNMAAAASNNSAMLQIIVIALLVGVATLLAGKEKSAPFMRVIDSLDAIILKIIDIIMLYAPIGVFALMAAMISDTAGNMEVIGALGLYAVTVIIGLLSMLFLFYPLLVRLFTKIPLGRFFRSMSPVQLLALTTSSSAATLPFNMETVEQKLGVSQRVTSFVLPMGMTINMDGASLYQAVATIFIAQVLGIELGWIELLTIVVTTTLSSIGTPGVPGGSIVILIMVLSSVGIPPEGLALILGLDRPLDMLRTVVNVTGDATVASVVDASTPTE